MLATGRHKRISEVQRSSHASIGEKMRTVRDSATCSQRSRNVTVSASSFSVTPALIACTSSEWLLAQMLQLSR
jgi:hypothetical protein